MALIQAGRWALARQVDVRIDSGGRRGGQPDGDPLPATITVHVGSARTPARVRTLGGGLARLLLRDPLPLHVGDRVLLRDPGAAVRGIRRPERPRRTTMTATTKPVPAPVRCPGLACPERWCLTSTRRR